MYSHSNINYYIIMYWTKKSVINYILYIYTELNKDKVEKYNLIINCVWKKLFWSLNIISSILFFFDSVHHLVVVIVGYTC